MRFITSFITSARELREAINEVIKVNLMSLAHELRSFGIEKEQRKSTDTRHQERLPCKANWGTSDFPSARDHFGTTRALRRSFRGKFVADS